MNLRPLTANYIDVVSIPANIASLPLPSKAIERLLSRREQGHNTTINSIKRQCKKYNLQIEKEIQIEGDRLKDNLETIQEEIVIDVTFVVKHPEELVIKLHPNIINIVLESVKNGNNRSLELIDIFYENVKNLERKRSKYFKSVFNDGYQKTSKIRHLLPYDLLNYFENEIVKFNEITMDNYYFYSKLHSDLKQQVQEETRTLMMDIMAAKARFKRSSKIVKLKDALMAHKHGDIIGSTSLPMLTISEIDTKSFTSEIPRTSEDVGVWSKQMFTTLDCLDSNAKKLVLLYKSAVVHIFNRFFAELQTITKTLIESDLSDTSLNREYMDNETYRDVIDDITKLYSCDLAELQNLWKSVTDYMDSNIQFTHTFLHGSAHIWDPHFARVEEGRDLMMQDMKFVINKHDREAQSFDQKINTTLDKLREESTVHKLNKHLEEANKFLDSIGKLYSTQCDAEIKVLRKYYSSLIDKGIDFLISEIDRFLGESDSNENIQGKKNSWANVTLAKERRKEPQEDPSENLIPHQMKVCQYQVDAVNNWMFGLWEIIRVYMMTCRRELTNHAESYFENIKIKLKKRLEIRLSTHKPRYIRIKTMIYDVRMKELKDHMENFHKLRTRVHECINHSHKINMSFKEDRLLVMGKYEDELREVEERLKKATKSQHVASCIEKTQTIARETLNKLNESFDVNHQVIEKSLEDTYKLICNFGESIKLFGEGGNYSRNEAKLFKKKLGKLRKGIPKKFKKIIDEYSTTRSPTLHKLKQTGAAILSRLELFKKEFEHNEKACEKIKALRDKIRNFAYEIKFKLHRLDACIDYYDDMSKVDIWKRKHFSLMKDAVQDCYDKIIELTKCLTGDGKVLEKSYIFYLNRLIENSYKEIEKMAKGFYGKHGPIINKRRVQASFGDFMNEVRKNYNGFRVQVEIHCLECVQDLIKNVFKLIRVNDEIYEELVKKFSDMGETSGEDEESEWSSKLSQESIHLEERNAFLTGTKSEKTPGRNSAVAEIILKNKDRVTNLHFIIFKLMDFCVMKKVTVMERLIQEGHYNDSSGK